MASVQSSGPVSWKTSGLPSLSLNEALMPGRAGVPVMRAWPVTGFWLRHIVVVKVQPIRRINEPSSDSSIFCPCPVARACVSAASAPPKASMAQLSSATEAIPASLQGRWGLSPMDCTSKRGDAKGLLVIGPAELRFYESRAVPGRDVQNGTDSIIGNFTYTGEGQTWTKFEALKLNGEELVRTESNPVASFTYARCK